MELITVADDLAAGGLDSCGGLARTSARWMSEAVSPANAAYARRVRRHEREEPGGRHDLRDHAGRRWRDNEQRIQRVQQLVTALGSEQAPRTVPALRESSSAS